MKKLITLAFVVISLASNGQTFSDPVTYNDYIVDLQNSVGEKLLLFNNELSDEYSTYESVEPYFLALGVAMNNAAEKMKTVPAYEGNSDLRDAAAQLFDFYVSIYNNEYKTLLAIVFSDELDVEDLNNVNTIMEGVIEKEARYDNNFKIAQEAFATRNNISLTPNELQELIEGE